MGQVTVEDIDGWINDGELLAWDGRSAEASARLDEAAVLSALTRGRPDLRRGHLR